MTMRSVDMLGNDPIICKLCKHEEKANLIPHLRDKHPEVKLDDYVIRDGGRLWNASGIQMSAELRAALPPPLPRRRAAKSIREAFGREQDRTKVGGKEGTLASITTDFQQIKRRDPHVPVGNPHYVFPFSQTLNLIMFLERPLGRGNNVYIAGPSGTGKTELVEAVADKMNYPVTRLDCDSYITRESLVGSWVVKGKETVFQYGLVPTALREGHILLINEYDTVSPHVANILKSILDRRPRMVIHENGGEVIHAHPDFRVVATANTWARGDESGMFINTHVQSTADLRRFGGFIEMDFLPPDVEAQMLIDTFGKDAAGNLRLEPEEAADFVKVATKIREACLAGTIDRTFSPAELVNWANTYLEIGSVYEAARLTFVNSYQADVRQAVADIVQSVWGIEKKQA